MSLARCLGVSLAFALACSGGPVAPTSGLELVIRTTTGADPDAIAVTLDRRLDALDIQAREIRAEHPTLVVVRVGPGVPAESFQDVLTAPGELTFVFAEPSTGAPVPDGARVFEDPFSGERLVVVDPPILTQAQVVSAEAGGNEFGAYVWVDFDEPGGAEFGRMTGENIGEKLLIVMDGELLSAPVVRDAIRGGRAQISMGQGDSEADARRLAALIGGGALPGPVELVEVRTFGE